MTRACNGNVLVLALSYIVTIVYWSDDTSTNTLVLHAIVTVSKPLDSVLIYVLVSVVVVYTLILYEMNVLVNLVWC